MDVLPTVASAVQILIQSQRLYLKARVAQLKQVDLLIKGQVYTKRLDLLF